MPTAHEIFEHATVAANQLTALAIAWHVVAVLVAIAMLAGWRLPARFAPLPLVATSLSVFMVSLAYGSWFNAGSFCVLAIALMYASVDLGEPPAVRVPRWRSVLGIGLVVFGLVYPHFLDGPWYLSLYAAPFGVLPCPTLAVLAGYTLLTGGHGTRAVPALLATWTAFYAAYGIAVLGVMLDVGLVVAAWALVVLAVQNHSVTRTGLNLSYKGV